MKKYLLPTIVSLTACSYVIAQEPVTPEVAPLVITEQVPAPVPAQTVAPVKTTSPAITQPAPNLSMHTAVEQQIKMMEQQKALMIKEMEQHKALMVKEMQQQRALMEKQIAQQKAQMKQTRESINQIRQAHSPAERQRLMDEMQKCQQEMREQMWKESGMMQEVYNTPAQPVWRHSQMPQYAPRVQYANPYNRPRYFRNSMQQHRSVMEKRLENIENMLKELLETTK